MTYRELSQEFGIGGAYISRLAEAGIIRKSSTIMLGSLDEEEVKNIRKSCLFSMLGIAPEEYAKVKNGSADFKETLKHQIQVILDDEDNSSQAAIVLQNMRRECSDEESLDPEPYLQHIKELKYQGGIFYDINTSELSSGSKDKTRKNKGFFERLSLYKEQTEENRYQENGSGSENVDRENPGSSSEKKGTAGSVNDPEDNNNLMSKVTKGSWNENAGDDAGEKNGGSDKVSSFVSNVRTGSWNDSNREGPIDHKEDPETKAARGNTENDENESTGAEAEENAGAEQEESTGDKTEENNGSNGYANGWSPYMNRGFGASNMGAGNWHGWTAGYGSYTRPVGARERVNNGEKTCPHPVRRYIARVLDTTLVNIVGSAVLMLGFGINTSLTLTMIVYCETIFWAFSMLIEPLLLTTIGTTPGKWIMGIKVRDMKTKENLDIKKAYKRAFRLAWQGFGFMIPIYTIFKRVSSFAKCRLNDTMPWDEGIDVEITDKSNARVILCLIAIMAVNFAGEIVSKQALIPSNRGYMTSEQFYDNVAEVMKFTGYSGKMPDFIVKTEGRYVKSVTLKYTDGDYNSDRYNEMYIAFVAFAGAAEDSNGFTMMFSSPTNLMSDFYREFSGQYCGISFKNESDSPVTDATSYSNLYAALYGTQAVVPPFNQTFTLST